MFDLVSVFFMLALIAVGVNYAYQERQHLKFLKERKREALRERVLKPYKGETYMKYQDAFKDAIVVCSHIVEERRMPLKVKERILHKFSTLQENIVLKKDLPSIWEDKTRDERKLDGIAH